MSERESIKEILRRVETVERLLAELVRVLRHPPVSSAPPTAGTLSGIFTAFTISGVTMSNTVLIATIPTTRQDGSALAASALAAITFSKTPAGAAAPVVLQTNSE